MRFSVISSGSKANVCYFEAASTKILIDCGLSCRRVEERLHGLSIRPEELSGILITHEHSDHIYGLSVFSRKYKLPVYCNKATRHHLKKIYAWEKIENGRTFWIGGLQIEPISVVHDAADPLCYVIRAEGLNFGQVTDLGRVTPGVKEALRDCNALVLESNYDQDMLKTCSYSWDLKQRIASTHGHLSNDDAGSLVAELASPGLNHLVLGHLSENSNTPEVAIKTLTRYINPEVFSSFRCASVYAALPITEVG